MRLKTILRNILITVCSFLILGSTLSFTVHKHYCFSSLKDVSILVPSQGCGMEEASSISSVSCEIVTTHCCNDIEVFIEGNETLKLDQFNSVHIDAFVSMVNTVKYDHVTNFLIGRGQPLRLLEPPPPYREPLFIVYQHFVV